MPAVEKPLFRPDALRPKLPGFTLPSGRRCTPPEARRSGPSKLKAGQARQAQGNRTAARVPRPTCSGAARLRRPADRTRTPSSGKRSSRWTASSPTPRSAGSARSATTFVAVLEGKGPRDPLDRPFAGRKRSAVEQALEYAVQLQIDWYLVTNLRETRLYHKGHDTATFERFETAELAADDAEFRRFVFLLGADRVVAAGGPTTSTTCSPSPQQIGRRAHRRVLPRVPRPPAARRSKRSAQHNPDRDPAAAARRDAEAPRPRAVRRLLRGPRAAAAARSSPGPTQHADPFNPRPVWDNFNGLFRAVDEGSDALEHRAVQRRAVRPTTRSSNA